jgi:arylformamidase
MPIIESRLPQEAFLPTIDLEAEYNNRARVPEHPAIFERWKRDALAFRTAHANAELGLAYGAGRRECIDLFWPSSGRNAPIALFMHGGYWRSLDPALFSHLAAGPNGRGLALALVGYDLCPNETLPPSSSKSRRPRFFYGVAIVGGSSLTVIPRAGI